MHTTLVLFALALTTEIARAQAPGMTLSFDPDRSPRLASPLTLEERQILDDGPVDSVRWFGGVAASGFLGFGIGQAVQGRWRETGWFFTLTEVGAAAMVVVGALERCDPDVPNKCHGRNYAAAIAYLGLWMYAAFHTWDMADAAFAPIGHNRRYHAVRARHPDAYAVTPYVVPTASGGGGLAGLTLRF